MPVEEYTATHLSSPLAFAHTPFFDLLGSIRWLANNVLESAEQAKLGRQALRASQLLWYGDSASTTFARASHWWAGVRATLPSDRNRGVKSSQRSMRITAN